MFFFLWITLWVCILFIFYHADELTLTEYAPGIGISLIQVDLTHAFDHII